MENKKNVRKRGKASAKRYQSELRRKLLAALAVFLMAAKNAHGVVQMSAHIKDTQAVEINAETLYGAPHSPCAASARKHQNKGKKR